MFFFPRSSTRRSFVESSVTIIVRKKQKIHVVEGIKRRPVGKEDEHMGELKSKTQWLADLSYTKSNVLIVDKNEADLYHLIWLPFNAFFFFPFSNIVHEPDGHGIIL